MKKVLSAAVLIFLMLPQAKAQTTINGKPVASSSEECIKEGDNVINIYYGTNVLGAIYKKVAADAAQDLTVKSFGPVGLVYEHLVTDVIGLGAEFGYSQTTLNYHETVQNYNNQTGQTYNSTYNYDLKFAALRIMFRANFHFAHSEKFDAYGLVSAGYRHTTFTYTTDNPNDNTKLTYNSLIPFGVKPGIGLRYFFTPNFGLCIEIAAGTPLIGGGISLKF